MAEIPEIDYESAVSITVMLIFSVVILSTEIGTWFVVLLFLFVIVLGTALYVYREEYKDG